MFKLRLGDRGFGKRVWSLMAPGVIGAFACAPSACTREEGEVEGDGASSQPVKSAAQNTATFKNNRMYGRCEPDVKGHGIIIDGT